MVKVPNRRVHFGDDDDERSAPHVEIMGPLLVPSSEMTSEEKEATWWQQYDYNSFMVNNRVIASESRRRDIICSGSDPFCYSNVILRAYKSCSGLNAKGPSQSERTRLAKWTRVAHTRRGLERGCVREIGMNRADEKKAVIKGVLDAQRKLRHSQEDKADILCMVSESLTRSARLYAAVTGEADEYAVMPNVDNHRWKSLDEMPAQCQSIKIFVSPKLGRPRLLRRKSYGALARICARAASRRPSMP